MSHTYISRELRERVSLQARHRCGYCNFTLVAGRDDLIGAYLEALARELSGLGQEREVDTLFFGGGTPTHLTAEQLERRPDSSRAPDRRTSTPA